MTDIAIEMAIEIADLPMKKGDLSIDDSNLGIWVPIWLDPMISHVKTQQNAHHERLVPAHQVELPQQQAGLYLSSDDLANWASIESP